jgi:integrase/recombinase XerC
MKTWIKKEVFNFVDYIKDVKNLSDKTEKTYSINLLESIKYVDIELVEQHNLLIIDLMPYRVYIRQSAKKTIAKKISIFRNFIKYLRKKSSYKIKLKNDDSIAIDKTLPKPILDKYIKEVIEDSPKDISIMIELIYALGLRISELESLKIKDIKNGWVIIKGKGGKIRQLPLLKSTEERLKNYLSESKSKVYLFEKDGEKMHSQQLRYRVSKAFKEKGLKVTPHQLRHSFATELLKHGAKISDVSNLLGHSSLDSTQIYTKLSSSLKSENYNKAHPLAGLGEKLV